MHGLPAFTDVVVFQRQPRPARLLCPKLTIVSVFHMFARLTCRRGSHVSDAEISFGTSVHGLPASTDADFSERQRTACPHYDSIISCGVSHTVWFQSLLAPKKNVSWNPGLQSQLCELTLDARSVRWTCVHAAIANSFALALHTTGQCESRNSGSQTQLCE